MYMYEFNILCKSYNKYEWRVVNQRAMWQGFLFIEASEGRPGNKIRYIYLKSKTLFSYDYRNIETNH